MVIVVVTRTEEVLILVQERPDADQIISVVSRLDERIRRKGIEIDRLREQVAALPEGAPIQEFLDSANILGDELCRLEDERKTYVENILHGNRTQGV